MIVAKECDNHPIIIVVMHEGMRSGADMTDKGNIIHQWVRKVVDLLPFFDPREEKETY
jgi:hypothetical protein